MGFFLDEEDSGTASVPGGFFIDESPEVKAPELPSLMSDPIGALTNLDWWFTRPGGEVIEPKQVLGAPLKALSGMTFGLGDEIVAGGSAGLDALLRGDPFTQAYDQRLAEVRGIDKSLSEANPLVSTALEIGGALKTPVLDLPGKLGAAIPAAKTIPQAIGRTGALTAALAGEGALYGGAYGFGQGEGEGRLAGLQEGAKSGGSISALLGAPFIAGSEIAGLLAPKLDELGKSAIRSSIGAREGDYAKTVKELDYWDIPDDVDISSLTKQALDDFSERGYLGKSTNPAEMTEKIVSLRKDLNDDLYKAINQFDKTGKTAIPSFERATKFIADGKVPADKADDYLDEIISLSEGIKNQGGGKLSYLQAQKEALRGKYVEGDLPRNGFNKELYHDLQKTIESYVPEVAGINKDLQKTIIVEPIVKRGLTKEEAKNWLAQGFQYLRTSGAKTVTGPAILGTALGGYYGGLEGAAAGAALGLATTPKGLRAIGEKLKALSKTPETIRETAKKFPAIVGTSLTAPQDNSSKKQTTIAQGKSKSSFNSTLDKALTQAEKQMELKAPQVIEVKRTSSKVLPESFVEKEEGGQQLKAYPPPAKGSGVTVASGVDLGQWSKKDLEDAGVSPKTILKVSKYLGAKDATARKLLKEKPLTLKQEEADELDNAIKEDIYGTVEKKLSDKGVTLAKLPEEAQAVVKSLAWNFGKNIDDALPTIWKAITQKDWAKVQDLLVNTKWKQPELVERRKREAELLSALV